MVDLSTYDYSAWYWRYIPHYRHVEDYDEKLQSSDSDSFHSTTGVGLDNEQSVETSSISTDNANPLEVNPTNYEFRDEANRKWYSFFDEYEYRFSTEKRKQKAFYRWFDKGTSKEEMKLVTKLDLMIVSFAIISYWAKYVDQSNVNNAYVSGMKEELGMYGNQYVNAQSMYNAGSVIFQVFYMYLFPRVSMHFMFSGGDILWSVITIAGAFVQNSQHLYVVRFFIGATEAGYFMMIHYLLGSWYKPDELGRRGGLYYCGQMVGTLTSGLLQAQIYETMNGYHGRSGWRWAFIIDGLITLPIGFIAFYMVPGTPEKCYSLFLTDDDIRLARKRLKDANIKTPSRDPPPFFNWKLWKKILTSWQIYVLSTLDALFWMSSNNGYNGFALWLKSLKRYSIPKINRLTTIPPALGVAFILAVCFSADILRSRSKAIFWGELVNFSSSLILAIWYVPDHAKWYAFMVGYFGITISSVVYGWLNDIMRHDPQARSIVLCWCNLFSNQFSAWVGRVTYPTVDAPRYHKGYTFSAAIDATLCCWVWVTAYFYKRQEKKDARKNGIVLYNSKTGDIPADIAKWIDENGNVKESLEQDSDVEHHDELLERKQ